jgi:hypothetical protein
MVQSEGNMSLKNPVLVIGTEGNFPFHTRFRNEHEHFVTEVDNIKVI